MPHCRPEIKAVLAQLQLAQGDARDVQQVVHHADHVLDLPFDDLGRLGHVAAAELQGAGGIED